MFLSQCLYFSKITNGDQTGMQPFQHCGEYTNCEIVQDKTQVNNCNAVLVHMPNIRRRAELPKYHPSSQLWVMVMFEPPWRIFYQAKEFNGVFNVSMTYSQRSDIYAPIGYIEPVTVLDYLKYRSCVT